MKFNPAELDAQQSYKLLAALVVPRPIAWVSTLSPEGVANLAPYSFFMMITSTPPHVAISVGARDGEEKDTLRNIRHGGDLVINMVSEALGPQMSVTSGEWPRGVDEFERAGLTPAASDVVGAPRVAEASANLECVARQIFPVGRLPYGAHLVICEVLRVHVRDDLVLPRGRIDLQALDALGRLTGDWYCSTDTQYQIPRPVVE